MNRPTVERWRRLARLWTGIPITSRDSPVTRASQANIAV